MACERELVPAERRGQSSTCTRPRDAVVKRRGRTDVQPIYPHALADPAQDQRGSADLAPEIDGRAHAHLMRR